VEVAVVGHLRQVVRAAVGVGAVARLRRVVGAAAAVGADHLRRGLVAAVAVAVGHRADLAALVGHQYRNCRHRSPLVVWLWYTFLMLHQRFG